MKLYVTDRARDDVELAFEWYERQKSGLGLEFLDCIDATITKLLENPTICSVRYSNFRACVVRRFPFSVFYSIESKSIIVHSVFDNRQDPQQRP